VGRIGSGVRVSASFQNSARLVQYNKLVHDTKIELTHCVHWGGRGGRLTGGT